MIQETADDKRLTLFAEVILPLPIPKLFTYRIPYEWNELAVRGKRVFVPFGKRKIYTAILYNISDKKPEKYEALYLLGFIDDNPVVSQAQLDYWQWMADYYMCPIGDVMNAALPAGLKLQSETVIALNPEIVFELSELDAREQQIIVLLRENEQLSIDKIENQLKSKSSLIKIIKSLYDRNLILISEDISETYKPKLLTWIKVSDKLTEEGLETQLAILERKAKKQFEVLLALLSQNNREAERGKLIQQFNLAPAAINTLIEKGLIVRYDQVADRISMGPVKDSAMFSLNEMQEKAYLEMQAAFEQHDTVLLHGVTGSGKTHLYVKKVQELIASGKQVLYLVPEIALTEQLIRKLELYFPGIMSVSHSRFSRDEKVEIWNKVKNGSVKLLVGARSALFMPFQNLGFIIIDEEHETSYKQQDKSPRYHARDAAMVLARQWQCKVLLGSATPSFESYFLAKEGKYGLVTMLQRYNSVPMPEILTGHIKEETRTRQIQSLFTTVFTEQMQKTLDSNLQAIVFQNRKGYVPQTVCGTCGWTPNCINCDIALTYYKYSNNLRCHYCGYHQPTVPKCEACGSNDMQIKGYGTERITEELELFFPKARIRRFDQDSTRLKHAFRTIINEFEQHQTDILVGTQIVAKGLDFDGVNMAAIINADQLLHFPDFRANERAFQLMTQLAGRAGRRDKQGVVVIQSYQPEHPVIELVKTNNYDSLYEQEIKEREAYFYPPYSRLIRLQMKHKDAAVLQKASEILAEQLRSRLGKRVLGPEQPYVSRIKNYYLRQVLVKLDRKKDPVQQVKHWMLEVFDRLTDLPEFKALVIQPDVDAN